MSRMSLSGAAVVALLVGCGGADTPERQIRKVIERMETAAEARDVGELTEHLSKSYHDAYGQGAAEASRHARGYFIANQAIHLLTKIESIDFPNSEEARATVLVGMVSREADASAAWELAADLYRFEISGCVGADEGDSGSAVVAVRSEIEGVVGCATRWGDESFCVGVDCRTWGEGVDVVD